MNIGNILNRRLGLITVPNLQKVINNLLSTIGMVDGAIPDSRPYKVYTALLTQTSQNAPVATVLENTLGGTLTFSRDDAGQYLITASDDVFVAGKTTASGVVFPAGDALVMAGAYSTDSTITLLSVGESGVPMEMTTEYPSFFEIRVYN